MLVRLSLGWAPPQHTPEGPLSSSGAPSVTPTPAGCNEWCAPPPILPVSGVWRGAIHRYLHPQSAKPAIIYACFFRMVWFVPILMSLAAQACLPVQTTTTWCPTTTRHHQILAPITHPARASCGPTCASPTPIVAMATTCNTSPSVAPPSSHTSPPSADCPPAPLGARTSCGNIWGIGGYRSLCGSLPFASLL